MQYTVARRGTRRCFHAAQDVRWRRHSKTCLGATQQDLLGSHTARLAWERHKTFLGAKQDLTGSDTARLAWERHSKTCLGATQDLLGNTARIAWEQHKTCLGATQDLLGSDTARRGPHQMRQAPAGQSARAHAGGQCSGGNGGTLRRVAGHFVNAIPMQRDVHVFTHTHTNREREREREKEGESEGERGHAPRNPLR